MYARSTNLQLAVGTRYLKGVCEMHDNRKQQARAAWKLRQARKRERMATAESGNSRLEKAQGGAQMITMICKWIKGAFS